MRIRTIKPEFWSHPVLGRLPPFPKLLAIGLLNMADDEGFFVADVNIIKSSLFPFTDDSVSIHGGLTALSLHGFIDTKKHPERGMLGLVVNFGKHQVINRATPSRIRVYWDSVITHGGLTEGSLPEQGAGSREQGSKEQGASMPDSGESCGGESSHADPVPDARDDGFDELWDAFNLKKSKPPAERAWRNVPKKDRAAVMAAVPAYVASTERPEENTGKPKRKYLQGWLNDRRWEDEITAHGPRAHQEQYFAPDPPTAPDYEWALQQIAEGQGK